MIKRVVFMLAVLSIAIAVWVATSELIPELCANSVVAEVPSPDSLRRAVVFERDCGATTDFSTQVSVLRSGEELTNDGGNTFIVAGRGPSVEVHWQDSGRLHVRYDPRAHTFRKETAAGGAAITYDPP